MRNKDENNEHNELDITKDESKVIKIIKNRELRNKQFKII